MSLIAPDEPGPVAVVNPEGASRFVLVGDHAGRRIPRALGDLGVGEADRARHIGWDIGIAALGTALAPLLDAVFVHQIYSRLVIDCNRAPDAPSAMPAVSDGTPVPGNAALGPADRAARVAGVHAPYHAAIAAELARPRGAPPVLIALHSFTPALTGASPRPWHCGILHDGGNDGFARALLAGLAREPGLIVGDNEPYAMAGTDFTVPHHAFAAGLAYAEIEVRQDLLGGAGVAEWAARLARLLPGVAG